jgi:hypothetical protein
MNINRRVLPLTGMLLLAGAFMQAAIGAHCSTVDFEVLSETPSNAIASAPTEDGATTADWRGDDRIVITTVGYQDCPVLPASISTADDVISIGLAAVPSGSDCGAPLKSFTTIIQLTNWNADHTPRLEVRDDTI